jgi:hypothetical protein
MLNLKREDEMDIILSGNIDRHNPKFFDKVLNRLKDYPYHRITRRESEPLSKIVVSHFGLNDKFQLKDKFEGEAFFKNASCVFASILSINKILNLNYNLNDISIETLNCPIVEIKNKKFRIVDFSFGQMPRFVYDKSWINDGLIFSMHRDEFSSYICGYIEHDDLLEKYKNVGFDVTSTKINVKEFFDFENLTDIKNLL